MRGFGQLTDSGYISGFDGLLVNKTTATTITLLPNYLDTMLQKFIIKTEYR